MKIIYLNTVHSTSTTLRQQYGEEPHATVVVAHYQDAGRGQRGNSWEAEPGKNLTFSILLRPAWVSASEQYAISEAVATAIVETLQQLVPSPRDLSIKWPNDIYWKDKKICGILIENTITGKSIDRSIAGIGININQQRFLSDAPNPVSLSMITHLDYNLPELLQQVAKTIVANVDALATTDGRDEIARRYRSLLWRRDGFHPYSTPDGSRFEAAIHSVAPDGMLSLRHRDGTISTHAFKEVSAIL